MRRTQIRVDRRRRWPWLVPLAIIALLAISQALLPSIAANRVRDSLASHARNVSVSVSAFPAIKLLFGQADDVTVKVGQLYSSGGSIGGLIDRARGTGRLDATVSRDFTHGLELDNVSVQKRGQRLSARATVARSSIAHALPPEIGVVPGGQSARPLALRFSATVFGHHISGRANVLANSGKLEIAPDLGGLGVLDITVFANPHLSIDSVEATAIGNAYLFSADGHFL